MWREKKDTGYCRIVVNRRDREQHVFILLIDIESLGEKKDTCYCGVPVNKGD